MDNFAVQFLLAVCEEDFAVCDGENLSHNLAEPPVVARSGDLRIRSRLSHVNIATTISKVVKSSFTPPVTLIPTQFNTLTNVGGSGFNKIVRELLRCSKFRCS